MGGVTYTASSRPRLALLTAYLEKLRQELPPTLKVDMFDIFADQATQRVAMVVENGIQGFILVLLILELVGVTNIFNRV